MLLYFVNYSSKLWGCCILALCNEIFGKRLIFPFNFWLWSSSQKSVIYAQSYKHRFACHSVGTTYVCQLWVDGMHCALSLNKDSSFLILPITLAPLVQFGWNLKWPTFSIHHWWWLDFQGQKGHIKARWVTFWPLFEIFSIHSDNPF